MKESTSAPDWKDRHCVPCEGGIDRVPAEAARRYLTDLPDWSLEEDGLQITRQLNTGDFRTAVRHLNAIAELAESEQHHPDLHLTRYRHLRVALTTHAIGGLSENDFVMAARIDQILS
ncbi:4a-hydroxytetrahydrobiopterin dehydratase [Rhodopirellula sp. P2]|uniref:4a-hydroxytetrahydrobiopterin dehydratase n=1 Tax=Rhodopirellula sp. P2 TaxID=2127060 RepID=UPI00236897BF|nr:4a-hydroxytetrahydrobiopterin dehydratase [Rhodopirellula sp. P2]WDQ14975.1 4a-hydroxytetrahydrobiopterin dehydratase [Rhodopirellula sp. P2]